MIYQIHCILALHAVRMALDEREIFTLREIQTSSFQETMFSASVVFVLVSYCRFWQFFLLGKITKYITGVDFSCV